MTSLLDSLKAPDSIARRAARAEARLERMVRGGGSSLTDARDWLAGLWPGRSSSMGAMLSSATPTWSGAWPFRARDRWSGTADRVQSSTRAMADELMRLGAAASLPHGRMSHHRPIGKVVLVAAGLGLLAVLARRS